jgi:hypothetical protein
MVHSVYRNARLITLISEKILYHKNWFVQKLSPNGDNFTRLRILFRKSEWKHKQNNIDVASHPSCCVTVKWRKVENVKFSLPTPIGTWRVGIDRSMVMTNFHEKLQHSLLYHLETMKLSVLCHFCSVPKNYTVTRFDCERFQKWVSFKRNSSVATSILGMDDIKINSVTHF